MSAVTAVVGVDEGVLMRRPLFLGLVAAAGLGRVEVAAETCSRVVPISRSPPSGRLGECLMGLIGRKVVPIMNL